MLGDYARSRVELKKAVTDLIGGMTSIKSMMATPAPNVAPLHPENIRVRRLYGKPV